MILKVRFLKSFFDKSIGLLGAKKAHPVYFKTRFGIHTFGMKFPIDVLILDANNKVVKIAEDLQPNKILFWNPRFDQVVELPLGKIKKNKIRIGENMRFKVI